MAYTINKQEGGHEWEKLNIMTIMSSKGGHDLLKCKHCGIEGKSYTLTQVELKGSYSKEKVYNCPKNRSAKRIRITNCHAFGKVFGNLTPGSEHDVVPPPPAYAKDKGTWVMGVGEPVKVLPEEFEII